MYEAYVKILEKELIPALGCTEPIAIAYAAAKAREVLGAFPQRIEMRCSGNVIKNVKGVTVPNAGGLKGIDIAATLGAVGGDPAMELKVLESVTPEHIEKAQALLKDPNFFTCTLQEDVDTLYIAATAYSGEHNVQVTIVNRHTLIAEITRNGQAVYQANLSETTGDSPDKQALSIKGILEFANNVDIEDVREILDRQIELNTAISDEGLSHEYGAQVGRTIMEAFGDNVYARCKARAAAGSDARMSGCSLPVVINSGSGNQGMTVSLPIIEYAKELGVSKDMLYRALLVSNLVAIHQKQFIGSLSAFCGAVTAACGSGAGITYLHGGSYEQISATIVNTLANVGGIVCDGAKPSCAAKIASSVDAAIMGHQLGMKGRYFKPGEGIVQEDVEDTVKNVAHIARVGMKSTDVEIINLMISKQTQTPSD